MAFCVQLLLLAAIVCIAKAGFVPPAEWCLPSSGLTELSGCIAMTDKEDECAAKASEDEKLDCYCTQEMLSSYFDCKSDVELCLGSHMFDNSFDEKVQRWHSTCNERIRTSVTTPDMPTITSTYDMGACSRLEKSCISGDRETQKCSYQYLPVSSLSYASCVCQPPIYSLFSECQYNGNISCLQTSAAESNILGYPYCSYFWSGSETLSSIDLTSFMSITAQLTQVPPQESATEIVEGNDVPQTARPVPAGTTTSAAPTGTIRPYRGHLVAQELR